MLSFLLIFRIYHHFTTCYQDKTSQPVFFFFMFIIFHVLINQTTSIHYLFAKDDGGTRHADPQPGKLDGIAGTSV